MGQIKRPLTMAQNVALQLREQILNREIKGGEPLRQDAIAKSFGISIIPVREAFQQLAAEGLVELNPHRGATVSKLTLAKAIEWIEMRQLIEVDMIGRAISNMTNEDIKTAKTMLDEFNSALKDRREMDKWSTFNWDFHSTLYRPANRPETMKVLASLHEKCDRYHRLQLSSADHINRAEHEHLELIELCRARDKRGAKSLVRKHLMGIQQDITKQLKK